MLVIAVWRMRHGTPSNLAASGLVLALSGIALVAVQLIPLPPEIWTQLPGRELVAETMRQTGSDPARWMPLSLSPANTKLAFIDMMPAFASFLAVMTVRRQYLPVIAIAVLLCAIIGVFLGMLQRNALEESWVHVQGYIGARRANGTFSNNNFFAMQLYTSLPFLAALAMTVQERLNTRGWVVLIFAIIYGGIILAGLAIIGSRSGIALAMVSVLLTILLVYRSRFGTHKTRFSAVPLFVLGFLLIFGQVGMVGVMQLAGTDPLADYRSTMFEVSYTAAKTFFPFGSGFGSFVPVYQLFETPSTILSSYVNHVHNDWLELVLEGGLAAMIMLVAFVVLFLSALVAVFQLAYDNSANSYFRAAAVSLLLILIHAIIDFGLRTPAIAAIAACCFAIMLCARAPGHQASSSRKTSGTYTPRDSQAVRPFSKPARGFQTRTMPAAAVDDSAKEQS